LETAAKAIGISVDELRTALIAGQTLAQVAEAKGVSRQTVVDALVAGHNARIDRAVAEGGLTAEKAVAKKAGVVAHVTAEVDEVHRKGDRRP